MTSLTCHKGYNITCWYNLYFNADLQILGLVIVIGFVTPLARSEWVARVTLRQTATSWFRNLVSSNMLLLAPFIIFQSMVTGILLVEYTKVKGHYAASRNASFNRYIFLIQIRRLSRQVFINDFFKLPF